MGRCLVAGPDAAQMPSAAERTEGSVSVMTRSPPGRTVRADGGTVASRKGAH